MSSTTCSVVFSRVNSSFQPYIRGVGTDAFLPNADPSVATYIDGINIGPSQGKQDSLGPVKRVEVLKGPGAFTGLRTATAVAQGLGFGSGVPVLPMDTLLAVAEEAHALCGATRVVVPPTGMRAL